MQQKQMTSAHLAASFVHLPQQSGNEQLSNDLRSKIRSLNRSKVLVCSTLSLFCLIFKGFGYLGDRSN